MTQKPPLWADLLLTGWVVIVAVIFFGPIFVPSIGLWTAQAGLLSLLMVMAAAVTIALKYLHQRDLPPQKSRKNGKRR